MTILRNKFFVGEWRYFPYCKEVVEIVEIKRAKVCPHLIVYDVHKQGLGFYYSIFESDLYESKEAYEAEQNQIRVGDEFYYMSNKLDEPNTLEVMKSKCISVNYATIYSDDYAIRRCYCFKTKELLLQAVKKAVDECE